MELKKADTGDKLDRVKGVQPAPVITSKRARQSTSVVLSRSPNKPEEQSTIVKVVEEATAKDKTVYGNSPVKKK
uniref:Uncharacterized protein n=1 Tax=Ditylenchus dipsaci TaxID=166011 RepID=A0A915CXK5_9BILA